MPARTRLERPFEHIAVLTLADPDHRNALSIAMRDEIADALEQLRDDEALKVLVVTGEGSVFSSGFDLREFERAAADADFAAALWASSDRYHHAVATFPAVVVAACNGPAIAGGFDLAVLCDLRVCSTTARFAHPEYAFGDVVYGPLRDLVGGALARDLCLTGRDLTADEALACHLVQSVVAPDAVLGAALELAERVAAAPAAVLRRTKAKALERSGYVGDAGTLEL